MPTFNEKMMVPIIKEIYIGMSVSLKMAYFYKLMTVKTANTYSLYKKIYDLFLLFKIKIHCS